MTQPRYVRHYGRWFEVLATFPEADVDGANAFMMAHPGASLLTVLQGVAYLAHEDDIGQAVEPLGAQVEA